MRHINVKSLWLQEKELQKELIYEKIKGEDNPADGLTKHVSDLRMLCCRTVCNEVLMPNTLAGKTYRQRRNSFHISNTNVQMPIYRHV